MTPTAFVACRPCLEEIDGFLGNYGTSDADGLQVIDRWRKKLLAGQDIPGPTKMVRGYEYRIKRKPVKKRR